MADYRKDKIARQEKAYRDKVKRDAVKNIPEPKREEKSPEDVKNFLELWKNKTKK